VPLRRSRPSTSTPPVREPVQADLLTFPAGLYCDFPIQVTPVNVNETLTFFSDGRIRVTGAAIIQVENLANGRTMTINSSGPHGLIATTRRSPQPFFLSPLEGGPGIFLYHGNVTFTRDEDGNIASITATGTRTGNLCADIA
jgi:hypothetical protein